MSLPSYLRVIRIDDDLVEDVWLQRRNVEFGDAVAHPNAESLQESPQLDLQAPRSRAVDFDSQD